MTYHERKDRRTRGKDGKPKAPKHLAVAIKSGLRNTLSTPMVQAPGSSLQKFQTDFLNFINRIGDERPDDTTVAEFNRWVVEDIYPFDNKPLFDQIDEKIAYEIEIGNEDTELLNRIKTFVAK